MLPAWLTLDVTQRKYRLKPFVWTIDRDRILDPIHHATLLPAYFGYRILESKRVFSKYIMTELSVGA